MAGTGLSITAADYNDLQSDVEELLGTSDTGTFGYGQIVRSSPVDTDDKVTINEYNNLRTDLLNIAFHQTGSLPSDTVGSGNLVTVNVGEKIEFDVTDDPFNQYVNNAATYRSNRFDVFSGNTRTVNLVDEANPIERNWDPAIGDYWKYGIECTVTVSFNSAVEARHFFNSGGKIRFSSRRKEGTTTGGTSTIRRQNENWSALLQSTVANRDFGGNTPGTGTSPLNGLNYYRLTDSFVVAFANVSASGDYSANNFQIFARSPGISNNSSGTARDIEFRIRWIDSHTENSLTAPDGVDGKIELFVNSVEPVQSLLPFGNWTLSTPTISSQTEITNISLLGSLTQVTLDSNIDGGGYVLDTSDAITVIGAELADDDRTNAGMALIYDNFTGTKLTELYDPNIDNVAFVNSSTNVSGWRTLSTQHRFGQRVAVSDNYIAISSDGGGFGRVHLYSATTRNYLRTIDGQAGSSSFASDLALSNSYLAVADRQRSGGGAVELYNPANGNLIRTISNPNNTALDTFGYGLDITSTRLIVGAPRTDLNGVNSGTVYCFNLSNGSLVYSINNPATATPADDRYGRSLAANEEYFVVGAWNAASGGRAYIHDLATGDLLHTLVNPNATGSSSGDEFGRHVAIGDRYCAVSAANEDVGGGATGTVYLFSLLTGDLIRTLNNPDPTAIDSFGSSLAMSNEYIAILKTTSSTDLYIERTVELGPSFDSE